jgi:hypothetical protein
MSAAQDSSPEYWPAAESKAEQMLVYMALVPKVGYTSAELADVADMKPKNVQTLLEPALKHGLVRRECSGQGQIARWFLTAGAMPANLAEAPASAQPAARKMGRPRLEMAAEPRPEVPTKLVATRIGAAWRVPVVARSVFDLGAQ